MHRIGCTGCEEQIGTAKTLVSSLDSYLVLADLLQLILEAGQKFLQGLHKLVPQETNANLASVDVKGSDDTDEGDPDTPEIFSSDKLITPMAEQVVTTFKLRVIIANNRTFTESLKETPKRASKVASSKYSARQLDLSVL